jgi:hypothetical protein
VFVHVVPAAQLCDFPPLHITVHAAAEPHTTVQLALPVQSAVQPPFGQLTWQLLFPPHATVEPTSTVTLHELPPPQLTVLFVPVESAQLLVPSHFDVQFDWHVPVHVDFPAQVVLHPVPHVVVQWFWESHVNATPFGAPPSLNPASLVAAPPNVHVAPVLHVHVVLEQVQSPEQAGCPERSEPAVLLPQPLARAIPVATAINVLTSVEEADAIGQLQRWWNGVARVLCPDEKDRLPSTV